MKKSSNKFLKYFIKREYPYNELWNMTQQTKIKLGMCSTEELEDLFLECEFDKWTMFFPTWFNHESSNAVKLICANGWAHHIIKSDTLKGCLQRGINYLKKAEENFKNKQEICIKLRNLLEEIIEDM